MKSVSILLQEAQNLKEFVNIINKYPFDIDLRSGRYVVDAKSILGILSLDLSRPIVMEIYTENCDDLLESIKGFIV